jgi:hypothetical protein
LLHNKYSDGTTGKWLVVKIYPVEDKKTGQKGSFSVTFTDEGFQPGGGDGLTTPTGRIQLRVFYANDVLKRFPFSYSFLSPANGPVSKTPLAVFFLGNGIDPGLSKARFVFGGFY